MTTYPDIPFVDGQVWSPELAYLSFHQSYGDSLDQDLLGNHPGVTDAQLSDSSDAIKSRVRQVQDAFKTTLVSGLTVSVSSGIAVLTDGQMVSVITSNKIVADNATNYIYINDSGVVTVALALPVVCYPIAKVIASGGSISSIADLRSLAFRQVVPRPFSIKSFGGVNSVDIVCTALTDLTAGLYYCRDFIVPSGVGVSVPGGLKVIASRNVVIDGTLTVTPLVSGGDAIALNPDPSLSFRGSNRGDGLGSNGRVYGYGTQHYGSGGFSGSGLTDNVSTFIAVPGGGDGGGFIQIEAGGSITGGGTISCKGGNGKGGYTYVAGSPVVAVEGRFEVGTLGMLIGSSGGSGGLIALSALTEVDFDGTLDVRGGNGGLSNTNVTDTWAGGGCPGSGGSVVITAPSYNISGATVLISGGSFGTTVNLVTGGSESGGVWTLPTASVVNKANGNIGGSFNTLGGFWEGVIGSPNTVLTPIAAESGVLILRDYIPLG